jgi:L-lactate dehydrogenase complex protein LldG
MSAREAILKAVRENKPSEFFLEPDFSSFNRHESSKYLEQFTEKLRSLGAEVIITEQHADIDNSLDHYRVKGLRVVNSLHFEKGRNAEALLYADAASLEAVDVSCMRGTIGVAENGAIWVDNKSMVNRLLPFICRHLFLVLPISEIVNDMAEAYERIDMKGEAYGVFIAGPSRTADIEQTLVIGAHGPVSMCVFLTRTN